MAKRVRLFNGTPEQTAYKSQMGYGDDESLEMCIT